MGLLDLPRKRTMRARLISKLPGHRRSRMSGLVRAMRARV
jgi:hypothetical protein